MIATAYVCSICKNSETDPSKIIGCKQCGRYTHFQCKGILGKAVKTARKKPFFCCMECADLSNRSSSLQHNQGDIMNELRELGTVIRECRQESASLRNVFQHLQQQMAELIDTNRQIEKSQEFLGKQFDTIQAAFGEMREDIAGLKLKSDTTSKTIEAWHGKHKEHSSKIEQLEMAVEKMNRSSISKHAVILGIPAIESENVMEVVLSIGRMIRCTVRREDVVTAKRLRVASTSSCPPIAVIFKSDVAKENFFEDKRRYGTLLASTIAVCFSGVTNKVTIRDAMTTYTREVLREAKEKQDILGMKYIWLGRHGKILMKRCDESSVVQITSKQELYDLTKTKTLVR